MGVATTSRDAWRIPPLDQLVPTKLSLAAKTWMGALRLYLVAAVALVLFRGMGLLSPARPNDVVANPAHVWNAWRVSAIITPRSIKARSRREEPSVYYSRRSSNGG